MFRLLDKYAPWIIALAAFVARLACIPYSEVVDADAVTRVFIAEKWLQDPYWIGHGVWAPFHFYLTGLSIFFTTDRILGPILMTVLFGSLAAVPIYRFIKNISASDSAIIVTLLFVFNPLVFRNSLQPLAGVTNIFFVAMAVWLISECLLKAEKKQKLYSLLAGLCFTVAAGIRYESWVLIALFSGVIMFYKSWKTILYFLPVALLFPLVWMAGNYLHYGNPLFSVDYATFFNVEMAGVNNELSDLDMYKRATFFPQSLLIIIPFGLILPAFGYCTFKLFRKNITIQELAWLLPLVLLFVVFQIKAMQGTLLLKHRFSIGLLFLALPYLAFWIKSLKPAFKSGVLALVLIFPLVVGPLYSRALPIMEQIIPGETLSQALSENRFYNETYYQTLPKLPQNNLEALVQKTTPYLKTNTPLVLDFFGWEITHNYALNSGVVAKQIFFLQFDIMTANHSFNGLEGFKHDQSAEQGIMILNRNSKNMSNVQIEEGKASIYVQNRKVPINALDSTEELMIYQFKTKDL